MADISTLSETLRNLAYLKSGGKPEGGRDIDKINQGFGIIDKTIADVLAIKKADLERQKTKAETDKINQETAAGRRAITPIEVTAGTRSLAGITAGTNMEGDIVTSAPQVPDLPENLQQYRKFSPDEAKNLSEIEKNLREKQLIPQKKGNHIFVDAKTGKELYRIPATEGTGDTVTKVGDFGQAGRDERKDRAILNYTERLENNYLLKKMNEQGLAFEQVDELANLIKDGNTVAFSALGIKTAKGMGEVGVMTESDVTRYVRSKQISQRAADVLYQWLKGTPSEATLEEMSDITVAMKKAFSEKVQPIYDKYVNRLSNAFDISKEEAARYLDVPYGGRVKGEPQTAPLPVNPPQTPDNNGFVVGQQYKMKDGNMATYKGQGVFE